MDIISKRPLNIENFKLFGTAHILTVVIMFAIFICLTIYAKKNTGFAKKYKTVLLILLIFQEVIYKLWGGFYQDVDLTVVFSLHLSSVSVLLCIWLLIRYNQNIFNVMYFWGLVAVPQAIITPGIIRYGFPHLRFFHIFSIHITAIFVIIYFIVIENKRLLKGSLFKTIIITNIYGIIVFVINMIFSTNYMFIGRKSSFGSILDYMGPWPYYLIYMDIAMVLVFSIAYIPMWLSLKKRSEIV